MQTQANTASDAMSLNDLYTVDQLAEAFPNILSVPALRWQLRHRDENGMGTAGVCVRVGKKLLLHRPRYEGWLATKAAS